MPLKGLAWQSSVSDEMDAHGAETPCRHEKDVADENTSR